MALKCMYNETIYLSVFNLHKVYVLLDEVKVRRAHHNEQLPAQNLFVVINERSEVTQVM